jgi:hypothetical protein
MQGRERKGNERQGRARTGKARQGRAVESRAGQGNEMAWLGKARSDKASHGVDRERKVRLVKARLG